MDEEKKLRKVVRNLLKEEISSSERLKLERKLCDRVEDVIDKILVQNNIHKEGLSDQQTSYLFRCILKTVDSKLEEFTSKKRPKKYKNYKEIINHYNL